ncbi:MAG: hypothetical protein NC091_05495 [Bacteroides sp.]|nr:hypothetical protein [Bacteroides sp.]
MACFTIYNTQIEVDDNLIKYLEHMHWLENEKDQLASKIEDMIKNKADLTDFSGLHTQWGFKEIGEHIVEKLSQYGFFDTTWMDYVVDGDCIMKMAEVQMNALNFEISAIGTRDNKSSAAYNQIVSEEFSRVKGLDFGIITNNFVGYMLYQSMNEKALQKSESQAYDNIGSRISHLENIYQNQMLNSIDRYYVETFIPGVLSVMEKTFAFITNKYLEALCKCGQLDEELIKKTDYAHSQSLIENNLKLLKDVEQKKALFVTSINYCPYNANIYRCIINEGLLESEVVELMDYVGVTCDIENQIKTTISKNNIANASEMINQLAILEKKDRKEIYASYFKDEYEDIKRKFDYFAQIVKGKKDEKFVRELSVSNLKNDIKRRISSIVSHDRLQWLADNCGFDKILNEVASLIDFTGNISYENVIEAYVNPIAMYAEELLAFWKEQEEKRKAEEERKRKELEEKRSKINTEISKQEQIVESNKHKFLGQGAKLKKEALARIEELKQELYNLK